ncbi:MAG TPA: N-acetylmuramoyl-L-alanine amidase [Polyangiaceae bacterium]|nr:N-acetylmuramoyl-L-alanine amidase [Polyangiaceae bacterium]
MTKPERALCRRFVQFSAVLLAPLLALGCPGARPRAAVGQVAEAGDPFAILPSRAEVVAAADRLAVAGARATGAERAKMSIAAARLRTRMWRLERREADALEALELYAASAKDPSLGCDAKLEAALLQGEVRRDPNETFRGVYTAQLNTKSDACKRRVAAVLETLAAFRPLPTVLSELEKKASGVDAEAQPAPVAHASHDRTGPVVSPILPQAPPSGPVRITGIERYGSEDAARIVVSITHPVVFQVGFIPKDGDKKPRLYVDIAAARYKGKESYRVGGLVEQVRLGKHKTGTRVVLDLQQAVYRKIFYLPEPFRLVLDVSKEMPKTAENPGQTRSVRRVVLDPGHGGHDPGAVGPGGLREKDVTLDVAHRAAPLIARELGISTMLTRDADDYVALDERAARANAFQADLFLSIHCNASEDGVGKGVMTFVLDESRDHHALNVAARENAASAAAAAELATALSQVVDQGVRSRSLHFAELLQRSTMASLGQGYGDITDQGVKRAGFYVLAGARMPAALYETSFISHPTEEMRLNTGDYRQKLADAIVNAVRAYREGK